MTALGARFAEALARKDRQAVAGMLSPDVDFKALTPKRFWEAGNPDEVVEILFDNWFGEKEHIEGVSMVDVGDDVGDTKRVGYRMEITTPNGPHVVEQQAYFREHDDQMRYVRVVCSGIRPRTD